MGNCCSSGETNKSPAKHPALHSIPLQQYPQSVAVPSHVSVPSSSQRQSHGQNVGYAATAVAGPSNQPHGASRAMNRAIRRDFLRTVHAALHDIPYMIIGGSALAEYGSLRETADVDVLVGEGVSKGSAESLLIQRSNGRIVRLGHGKIA
jgi:hypothetical protein